MLTVSHGFCLLYSVTTLGIVEFCLFLMAEYYPDYDKGRKAAFGAVHFCLFETALWNTVSTCGTAAVARAVSHRQWVQTERLDVTHYVELRRAWDAAQQNDNTNRTTTTHAHLRLQIRFHELRVQFLQAYQLPMQLQISDYLLRSEKSVLIGWVHISSTSWLLLTGAVCLLYYGIGMVYYHIPDQALAGRILTVVFFGSIALFVVVSYVVSVKMRSIFRTILETRWDVLDADEKERLREAQRALFWGNRPENVIQLMQFMQFGYAVAISTLILFWDEIGEGPVPNSVFLVAVLVCWAVFVTVTGHAIPQYTLCTSLGQLVDEQRLRETVAVFRLEEAKHRELERSMDTTATTRSTLQPTPLYRLDTGVSELVHLDTDSLRSRVRRQNRNRRKTQSAGVATMAAASLVSSSPSTDTKDSRIKLAGSVDDSSTTSSQNSRTRRPRGNRKKSLSDGVSAMFKMGLGADTKRNPMLEPFDDDDDDGDISEGYLSDDDDIPATSKSLSPVDRPKLRDQLRAYFLSDRYLLASNVFGTIIALILVGERVEGFIQGLDLITEDFVTLALPRSLSFWFLATWLVFCLSLSWVIIYLHSSTRESLLPPQQVALIAALLDACIFSVCAVLFFVAEAFRCCPGSTETECSCPPYGSRLGSGLGNLEPFTALVCLRVFRRWVAGRIVRWYNRKEEAASIIKGDLPKKKSHTQLNGRGVVEAWEQAVRDHPDLVARHGEFSGELLRVMLGAGEAVEQPGTGAAPALLRQNTSSLSEQGQEIVMTKESTNVLLEERQTPNRPLAPITSPLGGRPLFQRKSSVFDDLPPDRASTSIAGYDHMFDYPSVRLVRTMRRCDRMFLPLLNFWVPVDVVLTRFEMVYFDATRSNGNVSEEQAESSRRAVVATKGGKGLRLNQVATGRRVVGRMLLKDVSSIHVERNKLADGESEAEAATTEFWKQQESNRRIVESTETKASHLQDRLRIVTMHGQTLYLRFYSDVEDAKHHPEHQANEVGGNLFKNNAFQWAQTLARLCGRDQLKQPLPHYGQDNDDELRDFLIVADANAVSRTHRRGFDLRRRQLSPQRRSASGNRRLRRLGSTGRREGNLSPSPPTPPDTKAVAPIRKLKSFSDLEIGKSTSL